jgi:hypothetical protein
MKENKDMEQRTIGNRIVGTEDAFAAVADCATAMGNMFKDYLSGLLSDPKFDPSPSGEFEFEHRIEDIISYAQQILSLQDYQEALFRKFDDSQQLLEGALEEEVEPRATKSKIEKKAETTLAATKPLSLPEQIAVTGKLLALKNLVNEKDEFKTLRKSLDDYTGLSGPKMLKSSMYKVLGVEAPARVAVHKDIKNIAFKS